MPLRPLSVGEILEGSVRAMRANPRTMVGFSAIVIAVLALLVAVPQALALSTLLNSPLTDPRRSQNLHASDVTGLAGAGGLTLAIGLLQFVLATTIVSALLIMAVDSAVRGRSLQPGQLWGRVRPRLLAVIGLALLVPIVFLLTIVVALVPGLVFVFIPGTAFTVIGVILLVVGAIAGFLGSAALYLGFWAVAAPALLLENLGVLAALRRSYRLVRGMFWRVLGIGLLTAVMAAVLREVFAVLPSAIGGIVADTMNSHGFAPALVQLLITDVGTVLAGAVLYPFTAGVSALLYLDLRMRHEGLDVELMRQ